MWRAVIKGHEYQLDHIVIGGTLNAALFSYIHDLPLFYVIERAPSIFEMDSDGVPKLNLFRHMLFQLSLRGRHILADKASSIRIVDNILKITTNNFSIFKATYRKATVFDNTGVSGLPTPDAEADDKYRVEDWFNVRCGMVHEHQTIETADDFVNTIHFYPSERIDGQHNKKDLVAVSHMTSTDKEDINYSEVYVKFKTLDLMKTAGIRGAKNGVCSKTGTQKYYAPKIEHVRRNWIPLSRPHYEDPEWLQFDYNNYAQDKELWNRAKTSLTLFT